MSMGGSESQKNGGTSAIRYVISLVPGSVYRPCSRVGLCKMLAEL